MCVYRFASLGAWGGPRASPAGARGSQKRKGPAQAVRQLAPWITDFLAVPESPRAPLAPRTPVPDSRQKETGGGIHGKQGGVEILCTSLPEPQKLKSMKGKQDEDLGVSRRGLSMSGRFTCESSRAGEPPAWGQVTSETSKQGDQPASSPLACEASEERGQQGSRPSRCEASEDRGQQGSRPSRCESPRSGRLLSSCPLACQASDEEGRPAGVAVSTRPQLVPAETSAPTLLGASTVGQAEPSPGVPGTPLETRNPHPEPRPTQKERSVKGKQGEVGSPCDPLPEAQHEPRGRSVEGEGVAAEKSAVGPEAAAPGVPIPEWAQRLGPWLPPRVLAQSQRKAAAAAAAPGGAEPCASPSRDGGVLCARHAHTVPEGPPAVDAVLEGPLAVDTATASQGAAVHSQGAAGVVADGGVLEAVGQSSRRSSENRHATGCVTEGCRIETGQGGKGSATALVRQEMAGTGEHTAEAREAQGAQEDARGAAIGGAEPDRGCTTPAQAMGAVSRVLQGAAPVQSQGASVHGPGVPIQAQGPPAQCQLAVGRRFQDLFRQQLHPRGLTAPLDPERLVLQAEKLLRGPFAGPLMLCCASSIACSAPGLGAGPLCWTHRSWFCPQGASWSPEPSCVLHCA